MLPSNDLNVHDVLINQVKLLPDESIAISLSSGIDSMSVLFALLECNKNVVVYSFTLETYESKDFKWARRAAELNNLKFVPVLLPTDIKQLQADVLKLANKYSCVKKTDFICTWPYLYLTEKVEERILATGMAADGHFVISKKGSLHYKDNPVQFRKEYFSNPNRCQLLQRTQLAKENGITLFEPYLSEEMYQYLLNTTWESCNIPKQKMPIRRAFPDKYLLIQNHTNFQLGDSGIADHFDELLKTDWNLHNYKSITGIFNSVNRGELPNAMRKLV